MEFDFFFGLGEVDLAGWFCILRFMQRFLVLEFDLEPPFYSAACIIRFSCIFKEVLGLTTLFCIYRGLSIFFPR